MYYWLMSSSFPQRSIRKELGCNVTLNFDSHLMSSKLRESQAHATAFPTKSYLTILCKNAIMMISNPPPDNLYLLLFLLFTTLT